VQPELVVRESTAKARCLSVTEKRRKPAAGI
jgi:hypothetical protein